MATTYAQPPTAPNTSATSNGATTPPSQNPQLKRIVYSKYRELLGSYNDKANAIIETLPAYMVREDRGFHIEPQQSAINGSTTTNIATTTSQPSFKVLQQMVAKVAEQQQQQWAHNNDTDNANDIYGQREAPACVQNAMMTKDKKPFTYTPGGIDLSQIKSERMAKRLARNAQAEGANGAAQHNRPGQPHSPGSGSPGASTAAQTMGAAAMGMPFQVLPPPPPPPAPGMGNKSVNTMAPPPPPPPSVNNNNNSSTLAPPPTNGLKAPGSPNAQRKSPTPQRFEPPPLGFRPEIKIPTNPMANLRKVPPPVEKNTFWKDEYVKDRSKSPIPESAGQQGGYNGQSNNNNNNAYSNNNNNNGYDEYDDGFKKSTTSSVPQRSEANNYTNNNNNNNYPQQPPQPKTPPMLASTPIPPTPPAPQNPPQSMQYQQQQQHQQQQQSQSPRPTEFRSVQPSHSPAVNMYNRQTDSPRSETATPPRSTESPFRYAQQQQQPQQQQQQQQRAPQAISPLAQQQQSMQQTQQSQAQTVPWRTQRSAQPTTAAAAQLPTQPHPQPIYNNVQRSPADPQPQQQYQGPKPTNVGSLYIAPLAPPVEPQAQNIVRQQLQQQQQQQRDSPMRQMQPQQQQQQQQQQTRTPTRWMTTQPATKDQPEWVRPEENGNVVPSSLQRMKSPPPPLTSTGPIQQQQQQQQQYGNGYPAMGQNFGSHTGAGTTGLRLQINTNSAPNQSGPRERIIPIQLEQTPTYTPTAQPNFTTNQTYNNNNNNAPAGYVIRSPNQFVDQGYNNYPSSAPAYQQQQQQLQQQQQRVMSPTSQLNAPRMIQQQQQLNNNIGGHKTRVIPIALEGGDGTRGPISQTPIVIQNDPRSPPIQSKSFRILQKITDTVNDDTNSSNSSTENGNANATTANANSANGEPQLQRPQFARQMSSQQARNSPTIEQMRRMQIGQDQQQAPAWNQGNSPSQANKFVQQRPVYNNNNDMPPQSYIPPSEQQVPEPKKYTGSAIPSRSFKILQAMTTPENAAEMEDSDCNELNEITNKILNKYNKQNNQNNNEQNDNTSSNTTTPTPTPPPSTCASSSASSLNSNDSISYAPPHYPTPYGYPYPYWGPMPPNGEQTPPPPANWPYPYAPMPMPMPPPPPPPNSQNNSENPSPYPYHPYPYYYPYYPPPPQSYAPHQPSPGPQSSNDFDSHQNAYYDPKLYGSAYMPPPYPHTQYPYPVAPSYSQSSTSSRASSVLPDIIVTPSSDETPSQVILQHHIQVEKPSRGASVEIEEISTVTKQTDTPMKREQREGSVIDVLTKRLEDMSTLNMNFSNDIVKEYAGEQDKEFGEKSPIDNASPVHHKVSESDDDDDDSLSDSSDSEATPKCDDPKVATSGLQAIKSVTNIQVYKGRQNLDQLDDEEDDDDDDVTTADGESDIFDEDEDEHEHVEEFELDERIEENDDHDFLEEEEDLSTIYEEESEMDRTSDYPKTVIKRDGSSVSDATTIERDDDEDIEKKIEENDDDEGDDSTSVTVRLPLKFSFSRSSNDENIATVEVGKTEERRHSLTMEEKRNSFSIAQVKHESDDDREGEYDDDCEVSVTISLTPSSRSGSADRKSEARKTSNTAYPIEDLPKPESVAASSSEDVSVSFSLNMTNKLPGQTTQATAETVKIDQQSKIESSTEPPEEMDFFATLRATKLQAQKIKEQSASYWGKSTEKKEGDTETKKEEIKTDTKTTKETKETKDGKKEDPITKNKSAKISNKASLEAAKNDFWATVSEATKDPIQISTPAEEEVDFWASIEKSKASNDQWVSKKKTIKCTQMVCETIKEIPYKINILRMKIDCLPQVQKATSSYIEPEPVQPEVVETVEVQEEEEEEEDFWASVEKAKASKSSEEQQAEFENLCLPQSQLEDEAVEDFWAQNDENENTEVAFDPSQYPEEPREVDTDEEIDFWAEIEAKNKHTDSDDVNFYKSATFWSDRERNKSIDETPYMPVGTKPFPAKLPDEPTVNIDVWAALEAAKGDEPIIIDPVVEEEKQLAEEFNNMEHEDDEDVFEEEQQPIMPTTFDPEVSNIWTENDDAMTETASVHEPVVANVWEPTNPYVLSNDASNAEQDDGIDFWAEIDNQRQTEPEPEKPNEMDELEVKRNNYRKAMAFFSTSVDEQKEQSVDSFARSSVSTTRTTAIEEQSNEFYKEPTPPVVDSTQLPYDIDLGPPGEYEIVGEESEIAQTYYNGEQVSTSSSESNSTPTNFETNTRAPELPEVYVEPVLEAPRKLSANGLPDLGLDQFNQDRKISVKDRISAFETGSVETPESKKAELKAQSLSVESCTQQSSTLSRNNSSQRSESEIEEEDSGVTDMNKPLSETDTESDSFPELRKMSSYQRAATHSRLFKLLQDDTDEPCAGQDEQQLKDEFQLKPSRRRIVHNVSITRKQNPKAVANAETMVERRERLSLPLRKNTSIDADNPSTPASPASPIMGQPHSNTVVSDKLVNELVQSLLLKSDSTHLRTLPMEKLQAAAKRVLVEELDSLDNTSVDSTPAITPADMKKDKSYAEYYDSWSDASGTSEIVPSKAFRNLQDGPKRSPWSVRCPRVLSSKTINRDLARVTESPEIFSRTSKSPDCITQSSREGSDLDNQIYNYFLNHRNEL